MPEYRVRLSRQAYVEGEITIEADDEEEAKRQALERINEVNDWEIDDFPDYDNTQEVTFVAKLDQ